MPRMSTEDEVDSDSDGGDIPAAAIDDTEAAGEQVNGELQDKVEEEGDANEDSEAASTVDDDVYEVEDIRSHRYLKTKLLMWVKWKGYPEDQNTEESEEMLREGASEVLDKYFERIGGRPQHTGKLAKRKSTSNMKASSDSPAPKKSKQANGNDEESMDDIDQDTGTWIPKKHNWETEIASIDTVERDRETGKLWAFIHFNNKKRSKVGMEMVYKHCPVAMLKFYESHLSVSTSHPRDL